MTPLPVLEILSAPSKPGADLTKPSSDAGKLAHELCNQLVDQPGCQRVYIGHEVENPGVFRMFCEWDSHADHMAFTKRDEYGPFVQHFKTLFDGPLNMYHAICTPRPPQPALSPTSAPVTELGVAFFPADISQAEQDRWHQIGEDHVRDTMSKAEGFVAGTGGWVMEEQQHPQHGRTRAWFGAWAWTSKEAHEKAAGTEEWDRLTKPIQEFPGLLDVHMVHAHLLEFQKSTTGSVGAG